MLEINRKLAPGEVRKLLVSVVKREFNSRHYNILFCFFFFALRQSRVGFITFQTIDSILRTSKANKTSVLLQPIEITRNSHISANALVFPLCLIIGMVRSRLLLLLGAYYPCPGMVQSSCTFQSFEVLITASLAVE